MTIEDISNDPDFENEDVDEDINPSPLKKDIHSDKIDAEIESLHRRFKKGTLILQPDFQRRSVWDNKKSSRLIESAILGIPIPQIYTSDNGDGKEYIIDGQQRLTAFFSFIDGKYKLIDLWSFPEFNGKTFQELDDEEQEKILRCTIRTIKFTKDSDPNLKFEIFKRLNTGVIALNDQELRNCVYAGEYSKLLKELSINKDFTYLFRFDEPHKRMTDVELVLRFAAFYHSTYLNYKPPMSTFLNDDMRRFQHISEKENIELTEAFKNSVSIIRSIFGEHAFKRFHAGNNKSKDGFWEPTKLNKSLYDILMYSFAKEDKNNVYQNLDAIREALIAIMADDRDFIESIQSSTSSTKAIVTRFDKWRIALQGIIEIGQKEPRCFSLKLKEELYKKYQTCLICEQRIQDIDDAAIDHINQYWIGGKTIPENARLVHRYCNLARPKNDIVHRLLQRPITDIKPAMCVDNPELDINLPIEDTNEESYIAIIRNRLIREGKEIVIKGKKMIMFEKNVEKSEAASGLFLVNRYKGLLSGPGEITIIDITDKNNILPSVKRFIRESDPPHCTLQILSMTDFMKRHINIPGLKPIKSLNGITQKVYNDFIKGDKLRLYFDLENNKEIMVEYIYRQDIQVNIMDAFL